MENFKKYRENKNIQEIQVLLKTSPMDLLKSIARRYKLSATTKKKNLILKEILQAVENDKPFNEVEPATHQMSLSQLKSKARQLNIDFSSLSTKSDFQVAILKKMNQQKTINPSSSEETMDYKSELEAHNQTYLKALAKQQYGIKVSKLNKKQLVVAIIDAVGNGKPKMDKIDLTKDISKMKKNELIVKLQMLGGIEQSQIKGKSKEELLELFKSKNPTIATSTSDSTPPKTKVTSPTIITSVPITTEQEKILLSDKKFTIKTIRETLKNFKIEVPTKITARKDLIHLLVKVPSTTKIPTQAPPPKISVPEKLTVAEPPPKKPKKKPTLTSESEMVALDDIDTPFSPVPIQDLLDEPSEKQLQEELYRCLSFYEHKP